MSSLSAHFTLEELTRSETAQKRSIPNTPDAAAAERLRLLAQRVLEPLRQLYGLPLRVNSGYRSPALNAAVGGAKNSQHVRGEAADITAGSPEKNRLLLGLCLAYADGTLPFDQLIAEKCDERGCPRWLHISHSQTGKQRGQVIYS